jgi:hypothetical protein
MKKITEDIVKILNYKYELFESSIREIIENRYSELYKEGKKEGFFPVIVVPSDVLYDALSVNTEAGNIKELIEFSAEIDAEKFFKAKRSHYEYMQEYQIPLGEFSLETANDYLNEYMDSDTSHPFEEILIFKVPTRKPWEILGYIPMGGYNDCPPPDSQIAIAEYWYRKYRAVPTVITSNSIEFMVEIPPQNYQEAEKLAYEHYLFCNEIINGEAGTLRKLASLLKDSTIWSFWWE